MAAPRRYDYKAILAARRKGKTNKEISQQFGIKENYVHMVISKAERDELHALLVEKTKAVRK